MTIRFRPVAGVVVFLAAVGVAIFLVYVTATSSVDTEPIYIVPLLLGVVVGLVLSVRAPDNNIGLVVSFATLALAGLGSAELVQNWALGRGNEQLAVVSSLINDTSWTVLFVSVLVLLPIWFPDGRAPFWWSRWAARLTIGASLIAMASFWFGEEVCVRWPGDVCLQYASNPWGVEGADGRWGEGFLYVPIVMIVPAFASAVVRRRRSTGIERQQLKWFVVAMPLMVLSFLLSFDVFGLAKTINDVLSSAALCGVWLSIGVAVLRYRLYEIDRIISRTVTYAIVAGLLVGGTALAATLVGTRFESPLVVAATTLGVAAVFNPLRRRVQAIVDRRFNRSKYDAERLMDRFSGSLRDRHDADGVVSDWVGVVSETMQPASVGVWVRR